MSAYISELKSRYDSKIAQELCDHFQYATPMQAPRLEKIVVSCGLGEAIQNTKLLDATIEELTLICGQRAVRTRAKKSVANFKLRQGMEIGALVTLRGMNMYDFLHRLIHVALPRVKDFRGLKRRSFDGHGNYSLGITEQIIFPEIDYDKIQRISGFNISINTTANSDREAEELLRRLGVPFQE